MTKKPKRKKAAVKVSPPDSVSIYAALGIYDSQPHDLPIASTTKPSAEWLAEMLMNRVEAATEEDRELWTSHAFDSDEIKLHEAAVILDYYRMALLAIEVSAGTLNDPLQLREFFTKEQLENGVEFGSKRESGWPEIVTGYRTRENALKALKDWVDWERSSGPEWCRRVPQKTFKILGIEHEVADGEEWLQLNLRFLDGWRSCREVYLMRIGFLQYEKGLKWEREAKGPWEKRRKKVLGETSGENLAVVGNKVIQLGKSAQSKTPLRKRKKKN